VTEVNKAAVDIAIEKDKETVEHGSRGILHGIPVLVKDLFLTTDGMHTTGTSSIPHVCTVLIHTAGCVGLKNAAPRFEATAITKLRESGAVLLGKTSLTEWANYRSPGNAPNGWSGVAGQSYGIHIEEQDPGGSSSGSAVAVALGLCPAALGTEVRIYPSPRRLAYADPAEDIWKHCFPC
jgi:amidase